MIFITMSSGTTEVPGWLAPMFMNAASELCQVLLLKFCSVYLGCVDTFFAGYLAYSYVYN